MIVVVKSTREKYLHFLYTEPPFYISHQHPTYLGTGGTPHQTVQLTMPLVNHYPYPDPYPYYLGRIWITCICMVIGRILEGNYPFNHIPIQNK
jgi:hypothetical protein